MNFNDWYEEGKERGYNIASYCETENTIDGILEVELHNRQYSPFEFTAKEINDHGELADEIWDAFEEGIYKGIEEYLEEKKKDYPTREEVYEGYSIDHNYNVYHEGKFLFTIQEWDEDFPKIIEHMEHEKYSPNIYFTNDHGNIDLLDSNSNIVYSWV